MVLLLVCAFEKFTNTKLRIKRLPHYNSKLFFKEAEYWKNFYAAFTDFLFTEKKCFDNYVGTVVRVIRAFFSYLSNEQQINIGNFYERFYVLREQIPVISLLPEQVSFLINNKDFENSLSISLRRTKDIFVFGCLLALRYSDLFNIRVTDIEEAFGNKYLGIKTQKTSATVKLKLTGYTLHIIDKLLAKAGKRKILIPYISKNQFNKNIKRIAEKAGWTKAIPKTRNRRGKQKMLYRPGTTQSYRFCDLLSSHCMRRTAITMMLMFGVPEHIVRMISGHTTNSKSFYRYISLVQSYLDTCMEKIAARLSLTLPENAGSEN